MSDKGYAVFVTDSVTGRPVAIFAYASHANAFAADKYPGRSRVEEIEWRKVEPPPPACPDCQGRGFVALSGPNIFGSRACSRGCPPPFVTNAPAVSAWTL